MVLFQRLFACILCLSTASAALAGELGDFEQDVITSRELPRNDYPDTTYSDRDEHCDSFGECVFEVVYEIFTGAVTALGEHTMSWVHGHDGMTPRQTGDSLLPVARVALMAQSLEHDVTATRLNLEAGYGVFALAYNENTYREKQPNDELRLKEVYALYRMVIGAKVGLNLGLGYQELIGRQRTSGVLFSIPIQYKFNSSWGMGLKGTWSNLEGSPLDSYDINVAYHLKHGSVLLGYETLNAKEEYLRGPYLGFSLQW